jgi:NAD/NADP transhydrogenase alpha subunit
MYSSTSSCLLLWLFRDGKLAGLVLLVLLYWPGMDCIPRTLSRAQTFDSLSSMANIAGYR